MKSEYSTQGQQDMFCKTVVLAPLGPGERNLPALPLALPHSKDDQCVRTPGTELPPHKVHRHERQQHAGSWGVVAKGDLHVDRSR